MRRITSDILAGALATGVALLPSVVLGQSERADSARADLPKALGPKKSRDLPVGVEDLPPPSAGALLLERARLLDAREAELDQAERDLTIVERRLDAKIARLEALIAERQRVEQKILDEAEREKAARMTRMIEVTSRMPPERAALYLGELSLETAAEILGGIKARKAAAILAAMLPSKAAEISRKYLKSGKSSRQPSPNPGGSDGRGPEAGERPPSE